MSKPVEEPRRYPLGEGNFSSPERISARIASHMREDNSVQLTLAEGGEKTDVVVLDPVITAAILEVLRVLSGGDGYAIEPADYDLTLEQAAGILNIGNDSMEKILDRGEIPYTERNGCRRVRADALFAYKRLRKANTLKCLTELSRCEYEVGAI